MRRLVVGLLLTLLAAPAAALDLRGIPLPLTYDGTAVTSTVPIRAPDGSSSAPGFAFSSETNTGLSRSGAAAVEFGSLGVPRVRWGGDEFKHRSSVTIGWSSGNTSLATDTALTRAAAGIVGVTTGIALGTNPATAGAVRLANTATITARNAANDGNVTIATVNASDQPIFGAGVTQTCDAAGDITVVGGIITACTTP
jgi:hypothetical protein